MITSDRHYQKNLIRPPIANSKQPNKFDGEGFHTWQTKVKFLLMKKGIWNVTSGKKKKPNTTEGEEVWLTKDEKALAIIALGLSDSYIHHIDGCSTAQEAWEHLERVFGAQARCSKYTLLIKFFTPPLQEGLRLDLSHPERG